MRSYAAVCLSFTLAACPLLWAQENVAKRPLASKATRIESDAFLKIPTGLKADTFTVARTAPVIDVCFFEGLADRGKGTLWSSWGDGCFASNGKYYTSVGDHLGQNATSKVYEYDPVTMILRQIVDVLEAIYQMFGLYGYGKIHAAIHEGADGKLYFATYWGKPKEVDAAFQKGFPGSILLSYDLKTGKVVNHGAPVPKQGLPASHFDARRQLLYFHAVYKGDIAVYDVKEQKTRFVGGADESEASRTFLADAKGRVYFSGTNGLHYYDPDKNEIVATKVSLPANPGAKKKNDTLRAAAQRPTKDGVVYGMTAAGRMFAFDPAKESVKDLGPNWQSGDYTAVMVMSPDEKYLYYAPGAHGSGSKTGAAVVQYDIAAGQRKVLAFLAEPLKQKLNYQVGGTYNLQIDGKGERLFFTFNGADPGARSPFGKPAVVVLNIPASER
ncbi:MAG: hypothetical protein L0215_24955 [Gemmataceae bacterium]|nr:hypothetical protein [Gemmataceae bacterium]